MADGSRVNSVDITRPEIPMTPPLIFARLLLRARRQRALRLGPATFLLDQVAEELANRLRLVLRRFDLAVDLGTPTAAVRTALLRDGAIGTMIAVDPMIGPPNTLPLGARASRPLFDSDRGTADQAAFTNKAGETPALPTEGRER